MADQNNPPVNPDVEKQEMTNEARRSAVRRRITYVSIYSYLGLAALVILWLMWAGRYEVAIGVLGGVAGLAGSISGFWFGARRPAQNPE